MKRAGSLHRTTTLPRRTTPITRSPTKKANPKRKRSEFARCYGSIERVEWVRSQPSVIDGARPCVNAHTATGGTSRKADAETIVPLTGRQHDELHRIGVASFEAKYGVDLAALAAHTERQWQAHLAASSGLVHVSSVIPHALASLTEGGPTP